MPDYIQNNNNYRWSPDEILELIDLIKERPCLWNVNSTEYRDKTKKEIALNYLADKFNVTNEHVKTKIHTLRTQYTHERKKIKKRESETGHPCTALWQYYNNLNFMFNQKSEYDGDDSQNSTIWIKYNTEDGNNEEECDPISIRNRSPSPLNVSTIIPTSSPQHSCSTSDSQSIDFSRAKKLKISSPNSTDVRKLNVNSNNDTSLERLDVRSKRKDEYSMFGDYIACELRLLKSQKDIQCTLKNSILKNIIDANTSAHETRKEVP